MYARVRNSGLTAAESDDQFSVTHIMGMRSIFKRAAETP